MSKREIKIVVVAAQKGGVGKSTLSANLAITAEKCGVSAGWIDLDPQGSLRSFYADRMEVRSDVPQAPAMTDPDCLVPEALKRLGDHGCKVVFIDTPPSMSNWLPDVVALADFVLVPTQDGLADLRACAPTVRMIREADKPFAFALTMIKAGTRFGMRASQKLSQIGPVAGSVNNRVIYKEAWAYGLGVVEQAGAKSNAAKEIKEIWDYISSQLWGEEKKRSVNYV